MKCFSTLKKLGQSHWMKLPQLCIEIPRSALCNVWLLQVHCLDRTTKVAQLLIHLCRQFPLTFQFFLSDLLRRVSIVIHQHITKCEHRLSLATPETRDTGLFHMSQMELFLEDAFITPKYAYHFVRAPLTRLGFLYGIRKLEPPCKVPELSEIYTFLRDLFMQASLSAECSVGE